MRVLAVGRNPRMMTRLLPHIQAAGYDADGFIADSDIEQALARGGNDIVTLGGGVEAEARVRLRDRASQSTPVPTVIDVPPNTLMTGIKEAAAHRESWSSTCRTAQYLCAIPSHS